MQNIKINKREKLYSYAAKVQNAKLDCTAKALLWFYAYTYNWTDNRYSFYSQRKICAQVGMSTSTYQIKRKYLEDLGWIKVLKRGYKETCLVRVTEGIDDPDYESKSWAKWHPSNEVARNHLPSISEYEPDLASEMIREETLIKGVSRTQVHAPLSEVSSAVNKDSIDLLDWFG